MSARALYPSGLGSLRSLSADRRQEAPPDTVGRPLTWRLINVLTLLTVGLAPVDGYVIDVNPYLAKVAPLTLVIVWAFRRATTGTLIRTHLISWLALALLAITLCSSAINTGNPFVSTYLIRWVPFLVLVVVLVDVLSREVRPLAAVEAAACGAVVAAAGAIFSFLVQHDSRALGPMPDPNDLGYVLVASLPLVLLARRATSVTRIEFIGRTAGGLLIIVGGAFTLSRGAAIALVALTCWALLHHLLSPRIIVVSLLVTSLAALAVWMSAGALIETSLHQKEYIGGTNVNTRELRWAAAARDLAERPFLGYGPGGAKWQYVRSSNDAELDKQTPLTHNMYLEVGADLGGIGLFVFASILVTAAAATQRIRGPDRNVALAVQGGLLAACTASIFLSEEYYMTLWFAVATSAALELRQRERLHT